MRITPLGVGKRISGVLLQVIPDRQLDVEKAEAFWVNIHDLVKPKLKRLLEGQEWLSWEIVATQDAVRFYLWIPEGWRQFVEEQIYRAFPDSEVRLCVNDPMVFAPDKSWALELTLRENSAFSLAHFNKAGGLKNLIQSLGPSAACTKTAIQVLLTPLPNDWQSGASKSLEEYSKTGKIPFPGSGPYRSLAILAELLINLLLTVIEKALGAIGCQEGQKKGQGKPLAASKKKATKPGFHALMRLASEGLTQADAKARVSQVLTALKEYNEDNEIIEGMVVSRKALLKYMEARHKPLVSINGQILCTSEVANFLRLPTHEEGLDRVQWVNVKQRPIPNAVVNPSGIVLGTAEYRGQKVEVSLPIQNTPQHRDMLSKSMVVVGESGVGKTFGLGILRMVEIAKAGFGGLYLDIADGKAADAIVERIPEERLNDLVYLDFGRYDYPIPLGLTEYNLANRYAAEDAAAAWVDFCITHFGIRNQYRSQYVVRIAALATFENPDATLLELNQMITDREYQERMRGQIADKRTRAEWAKFLETTKGAAFEEVVRPIATKLHALMADRRLRNILCQKPKRDESGRPLIDFRRWADESKLVIVKAGNLPGFFKDVIPSILMLKLWAAALSRDDIPESARVPFFVTLDEPQTYLSKSQFFLNEFFSKARKYRFPVSCMIQSVAQAKQVNPHLFEIIKANQPHLFLGRTSENEAKEFKAEIAPFLPEDVTRLPKYHFLAAMEGPVGKIEPFVLKTLEDCPTKDRRRIKEELIKTYGTPVERVEQDIDERQGFVFPPAVNVAGGGDFVWNSV